MEVFGWDSDLETGLENVDKQHRKLVDITNVLGKLLSEGNAKKEDLENILAELADYTDYHFAEEEKIMEQYKVDQRHISKHKEIHTGFLNDVGELQKDLANGKLKLSEDLLHFLANWLVYHILGSDMSMSRQVESIKNGMSAEEAYETKEGKVDKATSMLLKSMNNLFEQVTSRNKELKELNTNLEDIVEKRTSELNEANKNLYKLATTDVLTGLANRRQAMNDLDILWNHKEKDIQNLSCMMIDADNFKQINDNYGHDAGDIVLQELSKMLEHSVRTDDIVYRLGGDEFFIVCPETDEEGVLKVAQNVHKKVNELNVKAGDGMWKGSISVGVSTRTKSMQNIDELIKQADLAVYASKEAGKNCVKTAN